MRKVYLRILPFAVLTYFFCYLDRINVGFASLTMNKDIGLDAAWYGMAAGAFFWGYVLFEVPSNIILEKPLQFHGDTISARARRGRALSRFRALFHLLVPRPAPRPDQFRFHAGPADRGGERGAGLGVKPGGDFRRQSVAREQHRAITVIEIR